MPVLEQTPFISHAPNGVAVTFSFNFRIFSASDLQVKIDDVIVGGYTVSGVGAQEGGSITFSVAPTGTKLTIKRVMPYSRETDYVANGDFLEETVDADFDRAIMLIQQLREILGRTPTLKEGSSLLNV